MSERGFALSVLVAAGMVFFVVVLGIAVDFSGRILMEQDAKETAMRAVRAAGQAIDFEPGSGSAHLGVADSVAAARAVISSSPYTGEVRLKDGRVLIRVSAAYRTRFLSIIGINTLPVKANAFASPVRTRNGRPR